MVQRNSKELGRLETVEHTRQRNGRVPGQLETVEDGDNKTVEYGDSWKRQRTRTTRNGRGLEQRKIREQGQLETAENRDN